MSNNDTPTIETTTPDDYATLIRRAAKAMAVAEMFHPKFETLHIHGTSEAITADMRRLWLLAHDIEQGRVKVEIKEKP